MKMTAWSVLGIGEIIPGDQLGDIIVEACRTEVLHAHQFCLSATCKFAKRSHFEQLNSLLRADRQFECADWLLQQLRSNLRAQLIEIFAAIRFFESTFKTLT